MRKNSKSNQEKFTKSVRSKLVELGGIITIETRYSGGEKMIIEFETSVGKLVAALYGEHEYCYTLFAIFEDVELAKNKFNCNPHSGKYNIHLAVDSVTVDEAIDAVVTHIELTL